MTKINSRQLCFIILTLSSVGKLFFLPGLISGMAEEGLIISTLINYVLDFSLLLIILGLYNKSSKGSFYKVLEDVFGKKISKIILVFYPLKRRHQLSRLMQYSRDYKDRKLLVEVFEHQSCHYH